MKCDECWSGGGDLSKRKKEADREADKIASEEGGVYVCVCVCVCVGMDVRKESCPACLPVCVIEQPQTGDTSTAYAALL